MAVEVQMNDYTTFTPFEVYWNSTANIEQTVALPSYDNEGTVPGAEGCEGAGGPGDP